MAHFFKKIALLLLMDENKLIITQELHKFTNISSRHHLIHTILSILLKTV